MNQEDLDRETAKALRERADDLWEEAKRCSDWNERMRLKGMSSELHARAADLEKSCRVRARPR
jgi:hypothetical protein